MALSKDLQQRTATIQQIQKPLNFFKSILGFEPWEKQKEIVEAIEQHSRVAIRSCNASGKTYLMARVALAYLYAHEDTIVITSAPTWKQIELVLWRDIHEAYSKAKYPLGGTVLKTRIELGSKWYAAGFSTDVPENFQGFHGAKKIIFIMDESSGIPDPIFEAIDGNLAGGEAKLIMIGNPTKVSGRFYDAFRDPTVHKIHISAFDTPNVKEGREVVPGLVTKDWVDEMEKRYGVDSDPYRVRVLGQFPKGDPNSLVTVDQVEEAIKREQKQGGLVKICVDVARFGEDETAIVVRQGMKVIETKKWHGLATTQVAHEVIEFVEKYKDAHKVVAIDEGNMGAGVIDIVRASGHEVKEIQFGSSAVPDEKKEYFSNLRSQMYSNLKDQIGEMDLPKNDDWYQLCNIKYDYPDGKKFTLEKKAKMKSRGLPSPDLCDALAMSCYPFEEFQEQAFDADRDFII